MIHYTKENFFNLHVIPPLVSFIVKEKSYEIINIIAKSGGVLYKSADEIARVGELPQDNAEKQWLSFERYIKASDFLLDLAENSRGTFNNIKTGSKNEEKEKAMKDIVELLLNV